VSTLSRIKRGKEIVVRGSEKRGTVASVQKEVAFRRTGLQPLSSGKRGFERSPKNLTPLL